MSTIAATSGTHPAAPICDTLNVSASGTPSFTLPSSSTRMSERSRRSPTKYGPSVSAGTTTRAGSAVVVASVGAAAVAAVAAGDAVVPPVVAVAPVVATLAPAREGAAGGVSSPEHAPTSATTPSPPNSPSASRRVSTRPTGASSLSMIAVSVRIPTAVRLREDELQLDRRLVVH
ncbi:MAG: hypothetical protein WEB13_06685 [Dehalococcoidia bacterium]